MSDFPDSLFTPREVDNREGVEYDAEKTKVFFAEDHNKATAEIVAIQEALGVGKVNMALDGWIPAGETWTYASATTFTITGDKTDKYQKGDKIKLTQTSVKYFYIVAISYSSPNTTITVYAGDDYSLANAAITSPNYSKQANPQGFPGYFDFTPALTGAGSMTISSISVVSANISIVGKNAFVHLRVSFTTGGTASKAIFFTPPYYLANSGGGSGGFVRVTVTNDLVAGFAYGDAAYFRVCRYDYVDWGLATGRMIYMDFTYLI